MKIICNATASIYFKHVLISIRKTTMIIEIITNSNVLDKTFCLYRVIVRNAKVIFQLLQDFKKLTCAYFHCVPSMWRDLGIVSLFPEHAQVS